VARVGAAPRSGQQAALGADVIDLLHALATPGVLISHPNTGFLLVVPIGRMIAKERPTLAGSHPGRPSTERNARLPGLASVSTIEAIRRRYRALVEWPLRWMMSERRADAPGISFVGDWARPSTQTSTRLSPDPPAQPEVCPQTPEIGVNGRRGL
jgi:hypothetical protein